MIIIHEVTKGYEGKYAIIAECGSCHRWIAGYGDTEEDAMMEVNLKGKTHAHN